MQARRVGVVMGATGFRRSLNAGYTHPLLFEMPEPHGGARGVRGPGGRGNPRRIAFALSVRGVRGLRTRRNQAVVGAPPTGWASAPDAGAEAQRSCGGYFGELGGAVSAWVRT